jgi:hypothetical protein
VPSNQYSLREREREREKGKKKVSERERERETVFWQNGENLVFKLLFLGAKFIFLNFKSKKKKIHKILYLNPVSEMYQMIMLK